MHTHAYGCAHPGHRVFTNSHKHHSALASHTSSSMAEASSAKQAATCMCTPVGYAAALFAATSSDVEVLTGWPRRAVEGCAILAWRGLAAHQLQCANQWLCSSITHSCIILQRQQRCWMLYGGPANSSCGQALCVGVYTCFLSN